MKELLAPAIAYAAEGFRGNRDHRRRLGGERARVVVLPRFRGHLSRQRCALPQRARSSATTTYRRRFRRSRTAARPSSTAARSPSESRPFVGGAGGFLARADLAAHRSDWVAPVSSSYRGFDVWELPPNGQGIAALQILNLLEGFDVRAMGFGTADHLHHFVEAKKLAFEDRARYYADPDFARIPVVELISKDYADRRRELIAGPRRARRGERRSAAAGRGHRLPHDGGP